MEVRDLLLILSRYQWVQIKSPYDEIMCEETAEFLLGSSEHFIPISYSVLSVNSKIICREYKGKIDLRDVIEIYVAQLFDEDHWFSNKRNKKWKRDGKWWTRRGLVRIDYIEQVIQFLTKIEKLGRYSVASIGERTSVIFIPGEGFGLYYSTCERVDRNIAWKDKEDIAARIMAIKDSLNEFDGIQFDVMI